MRVLCFSSCAARWCLLRMLHFSCYVFLLFSLASLFSSGLCFLCFLCAPLFEHSSEL